jgi:hypothetical protein
VLACFLKATAAGVDEDGETFEISDPAGEALGESARAALAGDGSAVEAALATVFGDDVVAWTALVTAVAGALRRVEADGLRACLRCDVAAARAAPPARNLSRLSRTDSGLPVQRVASSRQSLVSLASALRKSSFSESSPAYSSPSSIGRSESAEFIQNFMAGTNDATLGGSDSRSSQRSPSGLYF